MLLYDQRYETLSRQLHRRHIFITGGTGFVGKSLLDFFIDLHEQFNARFNITILSRNPLNFLERNPFYASRPWLKFEQGSLEQLPKPEHTYTDVIHAAADTHLQNQGTEWIRQIVAGTDSMLKFALQCKAERFLLTSSGAIYGQTPTSIKTIPEEYIGAPESTSVKSTYGQAKRVAEQLCTVYHHEHGLQTTIARCFAFCGKHIPLNGPYAIGNFVNDALYATTINVAGDGRAVRSYLDAEDMAHWLCHLLLNGKSGEAYNVGSSEAISIQQLADKISKQTRPCKPVLIRTPAGVDASPPSWYVPSTFKAEQLGLKKLVGTDSAVKRMMDHYKLQAKQNN